MPEIKLGSGFCILVHVKGKKAEWLWLVSDAGEKTVGINRILPASQHSCSIGAAWMLFRYEPVDRCGESSAIQRLRKLDKLKKLWNLLPDWSEIPAWLKRGEYFAVDDRNWGFAALSKGFRTILFRQIDSDGYLAAFSCRGMLRAGTILSRQQ